MFETPVKGSQYPAALSFLMGQGKLTKDFALRLLDPAEMKFEGGYVIEGTPKEATPAYQKLLLYVDAQTNQVRRALILDRMLNHHQAQVQQSPGGGAAFVGRGDHVLPKASTATATRSRLAC